MKIISTQELKDKLDRGEDVKLIMALGRRAFDLLHIPGSLHFQDYAEAVKTLDPHEEVIVYCSNRLCPASINLYMMLRSHGFENLYRYAGGLDEWYDAGYPLEGQLAQDKALESRPREGRGTGGRDDGSHLPLSRRTDRRDWIGGGTTCAIS
jgi:rhodanese-related sulfurtransferase